ncbi:hypothetical protein L202_03640 [Cryptococcus amylolentus CBS 6039]|uniref:Calcium uniporter protein, mitochondrial n=2 Tax=Cryptococcus amylolentus TaxID=104669 RepID=A0A1E3HTM7_9TREE|nr:hypothetical protein L202_03640 [Cryptococcus amylolentus CBS 6039]ODN79718.1 hypothetical protein L202_03640 [Cryptococcus amylolentus CBS 6039]ODO08016.1 hypothetical protein I350_03599 [Cryptococcus amylolentus CBS 6273]
MRLPLLARAPRAFLRPLHTTSRAPNKGPVPVSNATDLSHAHFISNASSASDFNPTQTPHAGQDLAESLTHEWKGHVSPTTSHLFKLIIPLPEYKRGVKEGEPDVRPTAFLLHPSQPLSHLSRLISGSLTPPYSHSDIAYLALTGEKDDVDSHLRKAEESDAEPPTQNDQAVYDPSSPQARDDGGPFLRERKSDAGRWQEVSWSQSTDLSDFIKQACLNEKFKIVITPTRYWDGSELEEGQRGLPDVVLQVTIPSFASRTIYIRKRLLSLTKELDKLTKQKKEIDLKAHKGAQKLAVAALSGGVFYWGTVIHFTFFTEAGWDQMEPVTWATGFAALLGSAAFLIYHNREVSYSSLLDLSITARQRRLYGEAGLDLDRWTEMVSEAKTLRREIERIAADYDMEWRGELEGLEREENGKKQAEGGVEVGVGKRKKDVQEHVDPSSSTQPEPQTVVKDTEGEGDKTEKIDIDKTIDEADELASQTENQKSRSSAAQRKSDPGESDKGSRARKGEGNESEGEMRGRQAAQKIIDEK